MQTSETRVIHQSTHTPVGTQEFEPSQPYLKLNLLNTVFNDQEIGRHVIQYMDDLQNSGEIPPFEYFQDIKTAIQMAWTGDITGSAKILRDVPVDEVVRFSQAALQVEELLLDAAQRDAEESFNAAIDHAKASAEAESKHQAEIETLRESIMSDIREELTHLVPGGVSFLQRSKTGASVDNTNASSAVKAMPKTAVFQPIVTSEILRADIANANPRSLAFLDAAGVFSVKPAIANTAFSNNVLNVKKLTLRRKSQILESLIRNSKVEPIGFLHLERLQFTPIGYERGELVYSLPMLPGETVRLSHREWSRTETEYSKLVSTEMETASQEEISEKSELTQASSTQQQHSSAYNTSVTASYGGGGFNISTNFGYNCNESEANSRQFSAKQAQDITKKASSRAKKDSKISFKVTTAYELEEQSFREIKNKLGRAVRYDFHRLMKKWRIDLYRYDVRLTYDIVVPEPGSYLLRKYIQLKEIEEKLTQPNPFDLISPNHIVREVKSVSHWLAPQKKPSWEELAQRYQVALEPPPEEIIHATFTVKITYAKNKKSGIDYEFLDLPEDYEFKDFSIREVDYSELNKEVVRGKLHAGVDETELPLYTLKQTNPGLFIYESPEYDAADANDWIGTAWGIIDPHLDYNKGRLDLENAGKGHRNRFAWLYQYRWSSPRHFHDYKYPENNDREPTEGTGLGFHIDVTAKLTDTAYKRWQMQCYQQLVDAARLQYESGQEKLRKQRDELLAELEREDALTLRKIEKEELMKCVLRWLLGPDFELYPKDTLGLPSLEFNANGSLEYYDETTQSVKKEYWEPGLRYGEMIKFLHQAIEWENVNYVLYPYFWTEPDERRWDFKQSLYHNDYVHRSFLRAAAARVVLTIRPGFEKDFLNFMEFQTLGDDHPYMTVADELKAMAQTKYPYTQDANVEAEEYIFSWENVPGNQSQGLLDYLKKDLHLSWAENAAISKSDDQKNICISKDNQMAEIVMDETKGVAVLKASNARIYDLKVKEEAGQHKIYKEQNWVDTWYEFTPTGALDVVEGSTLS